MRHSFLGKAGVLVLLAWCVGGCAWVHQSAKLQLNPQITPSSVGAGKLMVVKVTDRRASEILGYRGLDSQNASITTKQDVAELFETKIIEGLAAKGFRAVAHSEQPADVLNVEVKEIKYTTDMEFMKGSMQARAVLRVYTSKNGLYFDQNFYGTRKESIVEAPKASRNERIINAAISDALQRLFDDDRLMAFMAN